LQHGKQLRVGIFFVAVIISASGGGITIIILFVLILGNATKALVTLLDEGLGETLSLGQGDDGVLGLSDDEDVLLTRSEGVAIGILNVSNIVGTGVGLNVLEDTHTANIVTTLDENGGTVVEFDHAIDFISLEV